MDTTQIKAVPIGLEYLLQLNQLVVREKFSTFQGQSRFFDVLDPAGQRILQATQESLCCEPFYNLKITDNHNRELLEIVQECECTFTKQVYVYVLGVNLIGMVKLHLNSFVTHLSVMNPSQDVMLHIIGPGFQTNVFGNCCFEVKSRDEQHVVGMIKTENGQFFLTFPLDLDVSVKALLLGGCFFLDNLISLHKRQLTAPRTNNWQNRQQGYQAAYAW
uniref:Phospholipid scramblase n=1 Tax=Leptobrachium leishanense TaxID=445787 RepID=A0A8C5LTJ0_9ANUR